MCIAERPGGLSARCWAGQRSCRLLAPREMASESLRVANLTSGNHRMGAMIRWLLRFVMQLTLIAPIKGLIRSISWAVAADI